MICAFCGRNHEEEEGWVSIVLGPALWLAKDTKHLCPLCARYARTALLIAEGATAQDIFVPLEDDPDFENETDY